MRQIEHENSRLQVYIARDEESCRRIYQFRYRVRIEALAGESAQADHKAKTLSDPLDRSAFHIYAAIGSAGGEIAASVRLSAGMADKALAALTSQEGFGAFQEFGIGAISMSSQLFIGPEWQNSMAASLAMCAVYKLARRSGSRFDFSHCAPSLVSLYQRLGYRRFRDNYMDDELGYQVPLVLVTEDYPYLTRVHSPLMNIAREMTNPPDTGAWFTRNFPDYAQAPVESAMADDEFWRYLARKLNQTPNAGIPLLEGLSYTQAMAFIRAGSVLNCKAGSPIVKAGQMGREMFVILSGSVRVHAGQDKAEIATLKRGNIFGELAYLSEAPRTADVVASEDSELLVLSQEIVQKIMDKMPVIAARVLFNLSLILCARLSQSTRDLVTATSMPHNANDTPIAAPPLQKQAKGN